MNDLEGLIKEEKKRILIIENERPIGGVISKALSKQGYEVSWVEGSNEAFQSLRSFQPHLVIVSHETPNLTGLEFLKKLRKQEIYINVIVMSERSDTGVIVDVFQSGADDFICKPFRFQELFVRIKSSLQNNDLHRELLKANEKLKELIDLDYLTGLYNMRSMYDRIDLELMRAKRFKGAVACIMLDMDNFKLVNDRNDHLFGSFVIKEMGEIISQTIRRFDLAARYGGDEFLIILMEAQNNRARYFCENLRKAIEAHTFREGDSRAQLTISLGYIVYDKSLMKVMSEVDLEEGVVEGTNEGVVEGTREGVVEGTNEGVVEGTNEGVVEGTNEGVVEGTREGGFSENNLYLENKKSETLDARELVRRADHALYQAKKLGKNRSVEFSVS